ncbi:MAG TPA: hypothetical protein VFY96_03545 [Candidatus Binatia bacterium]|jgi:hypothetical protein|nr:hypothetical protein [Candidatus Binatia bacterium]
MSRLAKTLKIFQAAIRRLRGFVGLILLSACFIVSCTTGDRGGSSDSALGPIVQPPTDFETALKQNQAALIEAKGAEDLALYNIGVILAHPSNPKRDQTKAINSFKVLVTEYPRSIYAEPSKVWIDVLEQQRKLKDERQKLAEEKRGLMREKEMLVQERQKLYYDNEKSQQLDMEIEKRRRQSLRR